MCVCQMLPLCVGPPRELRRPEAAGDRVHAKLGGTGTYRFALEVVSNFFAAALILGSAMREGEKEKPTKPRGKRCKACAKRPQAPQLREGSMAGQAQPKALRDAVPARHPPLP